MGLGSGTELVQIIGHAVKCDKIQKLRRGMRYDMTEICGIVGRIVK